MTDKGKPGVTRGRKATDLGRTAKVSPEMAGLPKHPKRRNQVLATVDYGGEELLTMPVRFVVRPLALFPLEDGLGVPQDLDGDGFYEDINGDGVFDEADLEVFSRNLNNPVVRANLRAFDFNNDGVIDEQDLAALRAKLPASK